VKIKDLENKNLKLINEILTLNSFDSIKDAEFLIKIADFGEA